MNDIDKFRSLAEAGDVGGMLGLATLLHHSESNQDYLEEIISLYYKAYLENSPEGAMGLGSIYENVIRGELGYKRAVYWYDVACSMGYMPACCNLALAYENGSLGLKADKDKANDYINLGKNAGKK
jgi:TPR repeat protein